MASSTARAHAVLMPCCNLLHEVNLVPCLAMANSGAAGGGGGEVVNISAACCSSLNQALDAGRRCLCSLLLANGVLAGLVATLIPTLSLVLPLPGCYVYAPPLAACQVMVLQTNALPAVASMGAAAADAADPPPPEAAVMPPSSKSSAAGKKADGRANGSAGNGSSEAREETVSRSHACRHPGVDEGMTYMLMFAVVMAVFWFNYVAG